MRKRGRALSPRSSSATGARCVGAAGECTTGFLTHRLSCAKPEEEGCFSVANSILHSRRRQHDSFITLKSHSFCLIFSFLYAFQLQKKKNTTQPQICAILTKKKTKISVTTELFCLGSKTQKHVKPTIGQPNPFSLTLEDIR